MSSIGTPLLVLIGHLLPHLGADQAPIQRIVDTLAGVAPDLLETDHDLIPVAQDLILGLQHNPGTTQGQMVVLNDIAARFKAFEPPAPTETDPQHV